VQNCRKKKAGKTENAITRKDAKQENKLRKKLREKRATGLKRGTVA